MGINNKKEKVVLFASAATEEYSSIWAAGRVYSKETKLLSRQAV